MAVSSTTRKQQFVLDGIEDEYSFTFRALTSAPEDIKCSVLTAGVTTVLTYTTNYTVEIDSDGVGGTVTLVSAATIGLGTLTVYRETTNLQESDYDDYNQFPANTLEEDLDRRTMQAQELTEDLARCPKMPVESTVTDIDFPEPSARKGLKWNDAADAIVNTTYGADDEAEAAATSAATALAAQLAAQTSSTTAASHATTALTAATTALSHSTTAVTASTAALVSKLAAATSATTALSCSNIAVTNSTLAGLYATTASTQALAAATSATTALSHSTTALTASTTALSHSTTALTASTLALASQIAAATSATTALNATQIAINEVTNNYILALTDVNKLVDLNSAGAITLTVPSNSAVAIITGSVIAIRQKGAGQVTITTDGTVTINNTDGLKTTEQYAMATLLKIDTNTWIAAGSLET